MQGCMFREVMNECDVRTISMHVRDTHMHTAQNAYVTFVRYEHTHADTTKRKVLLYRYIDCLCSFLNIVFLLGAN
jgi:hypothetical protein